MGWLWLAAGFLLFMGLIGSVHALDRYSAGRFGYRPFALPNLAFMLIPHGVLATAALGLRPGPDPLPGISLPPGMLWTMMALGAGALIFMAVTLTRRTNSWIALVATALMTAAASVLLLSVFFRDLAEAPPGDDH